MTTKPATEHPIRRARKALGWTQEQLGQRVGVTKATVSAWECGHDLPSASAAMRLVDALGARRITFAAIYGQDKKAA